MTATILVGILVAGVCFLAGRACWRNVKAGKDIGGCGGQCSRCCGCHRDR